MDFKKHFSDQQTVTISVAKMGNQKITKSIFAQIPEGRHIVHPFNLDGVNILGYVNDKGSWILYTADGILYKRSINQLLELLKNPIHNQRFLDIKKYVKVEDPHEYEDYDTYSMLPEVIQTEYRLATDKIKLFITALRGRQIYL